MQEFYGVRKGCQGNGRVGDAHVAKVEKEGKGLCNNRKK